VSGTYNEIWSSGSDFEDVDADGLDSAVAGVVGEQDFSDLVVGKEVVVCAVLVWFVVCGAGV